MRGMAELALELNGFAATRELASELSCALT